MSKRIKFNGKTYTQKKCVDNILRVYHSSESNPELDSQWYWDAHSIAMKIASDTNTPVYKVAGVIAALSPKVAWKRNVKIAREFITTGTTGHTTLFLNKARAVMDAPSITAINGILGGNKIDSFFMNIMFPGVNTGHVTIDRHAISIAVGQALGENNLRITRNQYRFFVTCYQISADMLGQTLPQNVQSTTWVAWRKLKKMNV